MTMMGKLNGRNRVHKVLARAGYGKGGASKVAGGIRSERHDGIASELARVETETHADGDAPKHRMDRKPRASGGRTKNFHPGGEKGKLHREMGIPEGQKIPVSKLRAATHSSNPEKRRDAIRAETMKKWDHSKK